MTVGELKKRIEELDVSDDWGDLMIITYEEGMTVSSHDY